MLLDQKSYDLTGAESSAATMATYAEPAARPRWTVVMPFYNEQDFLPISLRTLAAQTVPFHLILVDNNSTDSSRAVAQRLCRMHGIAATLLTEHRPGKVSALQSGIRATASDFVATCDADTLYPADYLERAGALLDRTNAVAAVAATAAPGASPLAQIMAGLHMALVGALFPQQCHNGGAGQVFRTTALKAAGGFDPQLWNWVLEDHEIMARIERQGRIVYDRRFQCAPIVRPRTASTTGWNLPEQIRYHLSTADDRQAFFHGFLGPRLRERALSSDRLRRNAPYREEKPRLADRHADLHPVRG